MKIQEYLLKKADGRGALFVIFFLTLCESIFLFIPPEVFMTPTIVANKKKTLSVIIATSVGSLFGAIIAYMIGAWLFESIGQWIINSCASPEQFEVARGMFLKHGLLIILIGAFTPVPFKLLTICAGFLGFSPILYLATTAVGRTVRFAVAGFLLWRFQEQANAIVKKYFWPLVLAAIAAAGLGLFIMYLI